MLLIFYSSCFLNIILEIFLYQYSVGKKMLNHSAKTDLGAAKQAVNRITKGIKMCQKLPSDCLFLWEQSLNTTALKY